MTVNCVITFTLAPSDQIFDHFDKPAVRLVDFLPLWWNF